MPRPCSSASAADRRHLQGLGLRATMYVFIPTIEGRIPPENSRETPFQLRKEISNAAVRRDAIQHSRLNTFKSQSLLRVRAQLIIASKWRP